MGWWWYFWLTQKAMLQKKVWIWLTKWFLKFFINSKDTDLPRWQPSNWKGWTLLWVSFYWHSVQSMASYIIFILTVNLIFFLKWLHFWLTQKAMSQKKKSEYSSKIHSSSFLLIVKIQICRFDNLVTEETENSSRFLFTDIPFNQWRVELSSFSLLT